MAKINTYLSQPGDPAAPPPRVQTKYPCVKRSELLAAMAADKPVCEWRTIKMVRGVGHATLVAGGVQLEYRMVPFYGEPSRYGKVVLKFGEVVMGQGRVRELFVCPACEAKVETLIFFRGWKCRECQHLNYRSTSVPTLVRQTERLAELNKTLAAGRQKGVHESTMQKYRDERKGLNQLLRKSGKRVVSNNHDDDTFVSRWAHPELVEQLYLLRPDFE